MAEHIKGGEIYYTYLGEGGSANTSRYQITLKLYIDCKASSPGQLETTIPLTFFDKSNNNAQYGSAVTAPMTSEQFIQFDPASNPCIGNPPTDVCYRVRKFSIAVTLPNTVSGYVVAYQRCCRIENMDNISNYNTIVESSTAHSGKKICHIDSGNRFGLIYTFLIPDSIAIEIAKVEPAAIVSNRCSGLREDAVAACEKDWSRAQGADEDR